MVVAAISNRARVTAIKSRLQQTFLADWLDLDPPLLIANDLFDGARYNDAKELELPPRPGIGATRREVECAL
jgi:hypothetical protein